MIKKLKTFYFLVKGFLGVLLVYFDLFNFKLFFQLKVEFFIYELFKIYEL